MMKLGIDFGTTRTVVAVADRGNFPLIGFESTTGDVHDHFPSIVATDGTQLLFGLEAVDKLGAPGWTALRSFKRLLAEPEAISNPHLTIGALQISLSELLQQFLHALRVAILQKSNSPVAITANEPIEAFVAVPARASSAQRLLTLTAFRDAGFEVIGLLNEPSAAGVEYAHRYAKTINSVRQRVLVYDLGGGTFDISLVDMANAEHTVLQNSGVNDLGGDDFDHILLSLALAGQPPQHTDPTLLLDRCRLAKEAITPNTRRVTVDLDQESVSISTKDYYQAAAPLIARSIDTIGDILPSSESERFDTRDLAGVYVVGGGSGLPIVARQLREIFGRRVKRSAYASGATAVGLAIAAGDESPEILDRFSRAFGVFREIDGGSGVVFDPILTRDTPLQADGSEWTRRYRPAHNIGHFRFAECDGVEQGVPIGSLIPHTELLFPFDPSIRNADLHSIPVARASDMPLIEERYWVDECGIVSVRITDLDSGFSQEHTL